jgi:hypothetical protein
MPSLRPLVFAAPFVISFLVLPTTSWAQQATLGPSFSVMLRSRDDLGGGCGSTYFGAFGLQGVKPVRGRVVLQVALRAFWMGSHADCAAAPQPPPPDGTYLVEDRDPLQGDSFEMADARVGIGLPRHLATLSLGGGTAMREGRNVPYLVAALGLPSVDGTAHRFGWQLEYQWLRLTNERFLRTWQNGFMVSQQPAGTIRHWSNAITLGVRWGFRL